MKNIKIHKGTCSFCNNGVGIHRNLHGNANGEWRGPFTSYQIAQENAVEAANNLEIEYTNCIRCHPEIE